VEATADYVWQIDAAGDVVAISGRRSDIGGYERSELIGRPLAALVGPVHREAFAARLQARLEARTPFSLLELAAQTKDGRQIQLEISGLPLFGEDGAFQGYLGAAYDVTARKAADSALAYRDRVLAAITRSAVELVGAQSVDQAMPGALELIGKALDADRLLLVEAVGAGERAEPRLLHSWQSAGAPGLVDRDLLASPAMNSPGVRRWMERLRKGELVVASMTAATGPVSAMLRTARAKSILFVPIMLEGRWWGSLSVDDCRQPRAWVTAETDALKTFAELAGVSIMRERHESERRRAEEALALSSRRDGLTGLPNRIVFGEELRKALATAGRGGAGFAVHFLDLDHFKDVNDTRGHPVGDLLLKAVAERLRGAVRQFDVVARFGGDEFAILETGLRQPADAGVLADKVLKALREPFLVDGDEIHIGASVGIAVYEPQSPEPESVLSHAELALYRAKSEGRQTFRFFTESMDAEARTRVSLSEQLRRALDEGQFFLVYQPQVEMATGRILGVEALVRWRHPERGPVSPSEFIPASEDSGQIVPLGAWILQDACRQARLWLDAGIAPPVVSVNVSPVQFRRPRELEATLIEACREARIPSRMLQLEITETTLMEASQAQSDALQRLKSDGFRISLDDFGTGYSSLAYLRAYPVDQIKIAQVFVAGIAANPGDAAIVRAAISLARELGLEIMAEGAETREQAELLFRWGCPNLQGYYFSEPLTAEQLQPVLRRGRVDGAVAPERPPIA
jgi:diguanylate cyclase (GGDEF)-like protein/PAS domain S-box-containing protein